MKDHNKVKLEKWCDGVLKRYRDSVIVKLLKELDNHKLMLRMFVSIMCYKDEVILFSFLCKKLVCHTFVMYGNSNNVFKVRGVFHKDVEKRRFLDAFGVYNQLENKV